MMHLLRLTLLFQFSSGKTILSGAFRVNLESAIRVPESQSEFHLRAQGKAFHCDARQQSGYSPSGSMAGSQPKLQLSFS